MKDNNWLTEIISKTTKIFLTSQHHTLAKQLKFQLEKISTVELVEEKSEYDIAIHLAGYGGPSLEECLEDALKKQSRFILVIPMSASAFGQASRSVVERFGRNFNLLYTIVETGTVIDLAVGATQIIKTFIGDYQTPKVETIHKDKSSTSWSVLFVGALILLSPWILLAMLVLGVGGGLKCLTWGLSQNKWETATRCANLAAGLAKIAIPLTILTPGLPLSNPLAVVISLDDILKQADTVGNLLLPYIMTMVNPLAATPPINVGVVIANLSVLNESLAYLQSQLQQVPASILSSIQFSTKVVNIRKLVNQLTVLVPYLPQLEALSGQSQWLILLQDNTELRPTGGYIDGIALVKLENGHVVGTQFLSSAATDAQLRGEIEPPVELKQVLGETRWYLRDSNWDPDFPTTAARAAWFINKELDQQVDVVMAVNLDILKQMVDILGPIDLPQFGGKLTSTNLVENYLHKVKFDSSDTKLLPSLSESLYNQSSHASVQKLRQLGLIILSGLERRQIMVWTPSDARVGISQLNWDGRLALPDCGSPYPCVNQAVYLVDTNVGLNKVDAWISRTMQLQVKVTKSQLTASYTWQYFHSGNTTGWPGGIYKDYVRIYIPSNSQISQVTVGDKVISPNQYQLQNEHGLVRLALPIQINPGEKTELKLELAQAVPVAPRWHLLLGLPNQPGIVGYPVNIAVNYPLDWWVTTSITPQFASPGVLRYNSSFGRYLRWDMDWVPAQ